MLIDFIEEDENILDYLIERNLLNQYRKSKKLLLLGNTKQVTFKLRKPKKDKIYYFRINKQYRALGYFEGNALIIFKIDNHQN